MASAIGPAVVANSRERGGQRESAEWCGRRRSRATARRIAVAGERGRRAPFPS